MNAKIKKLMKKANLSPYYDQQEKDIEKFAELLLKECLKKGKEMQDQTVSNASEDYNIGRQIGIVVYMNEIKKEFGIE